MNSRKLRAATPIWAKITGILVLICVSVIVTTGEYVRRMENEFLYESIDANKKRIINSIASSAMEAIIVEDISVLSTIISQIVASDADIQYMKISNEDNFTLAEWKSRASTINSSPLTYTEEISYDGEVFGHLTITWDVGSKLAEIEQHVSQLYFVTTLIMLLFSGISMFMIHWLLSRPLQDISKRLREHSEGIHVERPPLSDSPEFKQLYDAVNAIEKLTTSKQALEDEIQNRKIVQDELAKARDAALVASRAKSTFLANMSHEIRTPLTAIVGFSETLLESDQSMSDRIDTIHTLIRSGKHLQSIINDILDLSKIEADKLSIESKEVDLFNIIDDIYELASLQAMDKGLSCRVEHEYPLPEKIHTDPVRLKQILINLCGNATKFTSEGNIRLVISAEHGSNQIVFKIIDSGIGMTSDQKDKLFKSFSQADSSITREYGGTGLGLYLSKQLAVMLGGDITVESVKDVGSCFALSIDAGNSEHWHLVQEKPSREAQPDTFNLPQQQFRGEILLAEDSPDNQRLFSHIIRKLGANVTVAENGKIAINMARKSQYDLILMDMQMPVLDGLEATRQLRKNGYKGAIVALTANAFKEDRDNCLRAGCNDFMTKPINRSYFIKVLSSYLSSDNTKLERHKCNKIISTLISHDPDMADLVQNYVNRLPSLIAELKHTYNENDWEQLRILAHNLKSTGGNFGFNVISECAAKLEFEILKKDKGGVELLFNKLDQLKTCILAGAAETLDKASNS